MLSVAGCKTALPNATTVGFGERSTTEWRADPRLSKKLKKRLEELESRGARSAAAIDQCVALQIPPQSADETAPGGQRTPQCTERDTLSPHTQTPSPPPTPMRSEPPPPVSIDAAPTTLESFSKPCSTPTFSDCFTEYLGFLLVSPHVNVVFAKTPVRSARPWLDVVARRWDSRSDGSRLRLLRLGLETSILERSYCLFEAVQHTSGLSKQTASPRVSLVEAS